MALLYRAIWTDDRDQLDEALWIASRNWIADKHGLALPARGEVSNDSASAEVRHADTESGRVIRILLNEADSSGRTWTTTATSLEPRDGDGTLWIDVDCDDPRAGTRIDIASPNLVRTLIAEGERPRRGDDALSVEARAVRASEIGQLTKAVTNPARSVPVVVLAHDQAAPPGTTAKRGVNAAKVLAGVARVLMLPPDAIDPFIESIGRDFAVWGGAMRIYLPGWAAADEDPARHRWIAPRQFAAFPLLPGLLVARRLVSSVGRQRPPEAWMHLRSSLARPGETERQHAQEALLAEVHRRIARSPVGATQAPQPGNAGDQSRDLRREVDELTELLAIGDAEHRAEVTDLELEMSRLQQQLAELQDQVIDAVGELEQTVAERDREAAHARKLLVVVTRAGVAEDAWTDAESEVAIDQITVEAPSEAVEQARRELGMLVIHEDACRDIERLDAALESRAWAATTWRGLRALHDYANEVQREGSSGTFWTWCETRGGWPASPKKLAMSESETVMSSQKLARLRELPIDPAVAPGGVICMQAHLKIATGGGMNIPRIYFHDDTGGVTGKIHVGFIGPHDLMPNKSTN